MAIEHIKRACAETLILGLLGEGPLHGYDVAREVERRTAGFFTLKHSTLYPLLHGLERRGLLSATWTDPAAGRPRKVYALTPAGRAFREAEVQGWQALTGALASVLPEVAP